jgi:methionyl-tRNA formyltransferase
MARIIFMGTPEFAVPSLLALDEHCTIVGVVTQPDRRAGRGRRITTSPVKEAALQRGLPIFQPQTLRSPEAVAHLQHWQPDLVVVAAFGQILQPAVLDLAPRGALNIHASLLPRYRGAAPIPAAILAGDPYTGVTLMQMDEGLDTGPIVARVESAIETGDTTASLTGRLADLGAKLLIEVLPAWLAGEIQAQPQDDSEATYCRPLRKEDGWLDWTEKAIHLDRVVRACYPWPGAYTTWQGQRLKVLRARPQPEREASGGPGLVTALEEGLHVVTGAGALELLEVQLAGKGALPAATFAQGQRALVGGFLGT